MKRVVSAIAFAVTVGSASAQWQAGFDVTRAAVAPRAVEFDAQGDVWALETIAVSTSQPGLRVARFSPSGVEQWTSSLTTLSSIDSYYAFSSGGVGPFATAAYRNGFESGIMRVDATGSIAWHNTAWGLSGIVPNYLVDEIPVDAAGNSYVVCATSGPPTSIDFVVLSFDALGALRWTRRIDGGTATGDVPRDVALDGFGGLYVCGTWNVPVLAPLESGAFALTRLDLAGNVLWSRSFAGAGGGGLANAVAVDAAGNALVAGTSTSRTEAWVVKWDLAGNLLWSRFTSIGIGARYEDIAVDAAGNSFATGSQFDGALPIANGDILTDARAANGDLLWHDLWSSAATGLETGSQISLDAGGRATVVGSSSTTTGAVTLVGRFERDGATRWSESFSSLSWNLPIDSDIGPTGNVVVAIAAFTTTAGHERLLELRDQSNAFCFGDGSVLACPCGNDSAPGASAGCMNSAGGSARLTDSGVASVSADSLALEVVGMPPGTICLFVQGALSAAPVLFGDGLRCATGALKRLYVTAAPTGSVEVPGLFGTSVSLRSAAEGDALAAGSTRSYQVFYRDSDATFCTRNTFNMSSGLSIEWAP